MEQTQHLKDREGVRERQDFLAHEQRCLWLRTRLVRGGLACTVQMATPKVGRVGFEPNPREKLIYSKCGHFPRRDRDFTVPLRRGEGKLDSLWEVAMTEKIITSLVVIVVVAMIACALIIYALRAIWGGK